MNSIKPIRSLETLSLKMGSVFRQGAVLFVGNILVFGGGFFFKIYLARTVGADGVGLFALGESLMVFALVFSVWSLDQTVFRFIPQFIASHEVERVRRIIWGSCWHVIVWSVLTAAILLVTRNFWADRVFNNAAFALALVFFALMLPARSFAMVVRMIARSYREVVRVVAIQTFICFPLKVALSVLLIAAGWGLSGWLAGEAVSYLVSAALLGWLAFHLTPVQARKPQMVLRLERAVYAFTGTMIGRTLLLAASSNLGTFLLGLFLRAKEVGIYSISITIVTLLSTLQSTVNGAFGPHIPELYSTGRSGELVELYYRITRWNLIIILPLIVLFIVMAKEVLGVFGPEFSMGAKVLTTLAVGQLFNVGTGPVGLLLTMTGHERAVVVGLAAQLAITVPLLFFLLPVMGLWGAGIAWSLGTIALYLGLYYYAKKFFPLYFINANTLRLLASAGVLAVGGLALFNLLKVWCTPITLLMAAGSLLYLLWGAWVFFGLLDQNDKAFVGEALRGVQNRFAHKTA